MNIKQFVIPAAFVALAFNASAQSEKTTATKTSTVNTPIKKKNAPIAVPKLSKAQLDTLAKSMAVPLKGMKDPAIKTNELSPTIKPTEDFYEYVNQRWIKGHPIPADKASYGMFDKLNEQSRLVVKRILENAANQKTKPAKGSNLQLLGDFYKSAMDTATINKVGVTPLQGWFSDIEKANTPSALTKVFSRLGMRDINNPIGYTVDVDAKNTTRYIVYIGQGGLGLPDKDFYFRKDEKSQKHLEEYKAYIQTIFELSGVNKAVSAEKNMQNVMEIENLLAAASMSRVELRNPEKNYNLYTIEKLKSEYKNIDWNVFFTEMKIMPKEIVVGQPAFFKAVDSMLAKIPHDKWVSYTDFQLLNSTAKYLSQPLADARFNFYGKILSGIKEMEPRWKRVTNVAEQYLRDLIGQEYVKTNFSPRAKKRALELVENIRTVLKERIKNLTWMSAETKTKALEKLNKIDVKVGYPDKWWTYEHTDVSDQPYISNVLNCAYAENLRVLEKLKQDKIDRTEWGMGPQTVNAYYNPLINEIVFPAAILQPPFFYENADDAVNYGGIGMVIGHEITHGFDDQGSQFDAEGNLKNWWTPEDRKNYDALTGKFVKMYSTFRPFENDSLHVNGELTLGENIADLGGMIISYNALQKALAGKKDTLISGFTPSQRFFLNYAIIWRTNTRPEAMRMQILSNEHSPAKFRVNGVLSNLPEFYKAFNVKPTDKMYIKEEDREKMW
ncbi:MAG: M13 family metallopeptidase [Chitinophagales bacterium]